MWNAWIHGTLDSAGERKFSSRIEWTLRYLFLGSYLPYTVLVIIFRLFKQSVFNGDNWKEKFIRNKECCIDFGSEVYKGASHNCLDFIKKMLEKDPKRRITATEALAHPFLASEYKEDLSEEEKVSNWFG